MKRALFCLTLSTTLGLTLAVGLVWLLDYSVFQVAYAAPLRADLVVTTTIQAAINAAQPGDTVVVPAGVYTESLTLNKAVSLTGESAATTIINAVTNQRVLTVTGASISNTVIISGLTFANGRLINGAPPNDCSVGKCGGGMAVITNARPLLQNIIITNCTAAYAGGGLYVDASAALNAINAKLFNNTAYYGGGAYAAGTATLTGGHFENNRCTASITYCGGGLYAGALVLSGTQFFSNTAAYHGGGAYTSGSAKITNGHFENNRCAGGGCSGGGLYAGTTTLTDTLFISNSAISQGGGAYANGPARISGGLFQRNQTINEGGGLYVNSTLNLTDMQFLSNTASGGGGAYVAGATTLNNGAFENNLSTSTGSFGGGLWAVGALALTDTQFLNNQAANSGGGVYAAAAVTITGGLFQNNRITTTLGGGLTAGGPLTISGTQFISNTAATSGGGVYANNNAKITNGLFRGNRSLTNDGAGVYASSSLTLTDTQFLTNTASGSSGRGGGAYVGGLTTLTRGLFQYNLANAGGGLYANTTVALTGTQFINNRGSSGNGLYIPQSVSGESRLVNPLFARNGSSASTALYLFNPSGSGGNAVILHATFAGTGASSSSAIYVGKGSVGITNTIVASYTTGIDWSGGSGAVYEDYNLFYNVAITGTSVITHGIHSRVGYNPAFLNPANDDYHLTALSAANDMGVGAGISTDFEGELRPQQNGFDIGCDESPYPQVLTDLRLSKTVTPAAARPGQTVTYILVFSNSGLATATGIVITDMIPLSMTIQNIANSGAAITDTGYLPAYAWNVQDLAPGQGGVITVTALMSTPLSTGIFTNTAIITTTAPDINSNNNASSMGVTVLNVAPAAQDLHLSTDEYTPLSGTLNASDANDDVLRYAILGYPVSGTVAITNALTGGFIYTPTNRLSNYSDVFVYIVTDTGSLTDTATVTVTVAADNDPPVLGSIGDRAVDELTTLVFTATATDSDLPPQTLTYALNDAPPGADFNTATGAFSWTPSEAQGPGVYTITLGVSDGALTDTETIHVTVAEINVAPVLNTIGDKSVDELTTLVFTATATDSDLPPETLTYTLDDAPPGADFNPATGAFSWTPSEAQGPGIYTITLGVSDGVLTDTETIHITVAEINAAPDAVNDSGVTTRNEAMTLPVLANDTDADGDTLSISNVTTPLHGMAVISGSTEIVYMPAPSYIGMDTFSYTVSDGEMGLDTATVTVTVMEQIYFPLIFR